MLREVERGCERLRGVRYCIMRASTVGLMGCKRGYLLNSSKKGFRLLYHELF